MTHAQPMENPMIERFEGIGISRFVFEKNTRRGRGIDPAGRTHGTGVSGSSFMTGVRRSA